MTAFNCGYDGKYAFRRIGGNDLWHIKERVWHELESPILKIWGLYVSDGMDLICHTFASFAFGFTKHFEGSLKTET